MTTGTPPGHGERDGGGWTVSAYQRCDPGAYEGAADLYCRHLEKVHHCPPALLDPLRGGSSQGSWLAVDDLHRAYLGFHAGGEHGKPDD